MLRNPNRGDCDMLTVPDEQLFTRSRSVVSRVVAGETLIVPVRGKVGDLASIYSFNSTGSLIWQLLDAPRSLPELIDAVESEYEVGQEQAQKDVTQFLNDLRSVGLLDVCPRVAMAETEMTSMDMTATESNRHALETAGSH
jgi:Coenzyme PQQ synthesis protein D (PqqD)